MANPKVTLTVDVSAYREALEAVGHAMKWELDLAIALGYELESWDGVWKLKPNPFTIGPDYILAEEVVYHEGTHEPIIIEDEEVTQFVKHPVPAGWRSEPVYRVVPPTD